MGFGAKVKNIFADPAQCGIAINPMCSMLRRKIMVLRYAVRYIIRRISNHVFSFKLPLKKYSYIFLILSPIRGDIHWYSPEKRHWAGSWSCALPRSAES
jgi:hypothetical protein